MQQNQLKKKKLLQEEKSNNYCKPGEMDMQFNKGGKVQTI